jgi:hypothetical protein
VISPVAWLKVKPQGSGGEEVNLVAAPPSADMSGLLDGNTIPTANDMSGVVYVVIIGFTGNTVRKMCPPQLPRAFCPQTTYSIFSTTSVGVPLITPVRGSSVNPAGSALSRRYVSGAPPVFVGATGSILVSTVKLCLSGTKSRCGRDARTFSERLNALNPPEFMATTRYV